MTTKLIVLVLFFNFLFSYSQNKKVVIADEIDKSSLPFATIKVLNKNQGYYSDVNGLITIPNYNLDSLLIEYSGYLSSKLIVKENVDTIFLRRNVTKLANVIVRNPKNKHQVGVFNYRKSFTISFSHSMEYAKTLDMSQIIGDYKIQELFVPVGYNNNDSNDCNCKLHLYKANDKGEPGEDLLKKTVFLKKESFLKNDFNIDVSDQNLFLSEKLLFISVECILTPIVNNIKVIKQQQQPGPYSPLYLFSSGKSQFFDKTYNHTFFRLLNSKYYSWTGSKNEIFPPNFSAGVIILTN